MTYFPQSDPAFNYLRHMVLLYGSAAAPWSSGSLKSYVAHVDTSGRPDDWFFDSFLFLNVRSSRGRDYCADINLGTSMAGEGDFFAACSPRPAAMEDWEELLDFYFSAEGVVPTLERTIEECLVEVGREYGHKRNVVLMLPYPHITQKAFGVLPEGTMLDFSTAEQDLAHATENRLRAGIWMTDEIQRRFALCHPHHLHLLGVYWMFESVYRSWDIDDHWLLKELRRHVNSRGLKLLWIPFWSTYNVHLLDDYRRYYFDLAFLQPNYLFYRNGKTIAGAAEAAAARYAGIEMEYYLELDEPIAVGGERHKRFREYLDGGLTYGYMRGAACAHFQGTGALEKMRTHPDPVERTFYEDIFAFVKGTYQSH